MKLQINNKQNIFFCSDPHYGHAGIVRGTSTWEGKRGCRDFDTLDEHDQALVDNINKTVGEDDILFCLGDWSFGEYKTGDNVTNIKKFRDQIICKNVHLILGNHCQEIKKNKNNEQELFSSVNPYLEILVIEQPEKQGEKAIKQHIVLSHYSHRTWNKAFNGSWMLFGHSHGSLGELPGKTMDVGFDTHPEFRPYSFQELKEIMERRNVTIEVDHHNGE
jgi:calcineurin-like phosphoesterase family protein